MDSGGDATRSNFIEILEQLDPLPDLPETGEDRFFSKEALDFQYATAAAENPLFPTWGSTGAEMASIGATAAAAAAAAATAATSATPAASAGSAMTPPPSATAVTATAAVAVAAKRTPPAPSPAARTCGTKRALPDTQFPPRPRAAGGASGADRTVFLRKRLGGESVSSGNSSTSTCSDNGSASEDVAGEWEGGGGGGGNGGGGSGGSGGGAQRPNHVVQGPPAFSRSGLRNGGSPAAETTAAAAAEEATAAATATTAAGAVAESAGSTQAAHTAALRNRLGGSTSKGHRCKKPRSSGGGGSSSSSSGGGTVGGYASWDALVKPLKQQWDHVEAPAVGPSAGASKAAAAAVPLESGSVCSVFSPEPRPNDTTAFSVEQCSAQAHPMAVASYVLRVRCGGGAHIVRRTWDDIVSLCTMLGRDLALPATGAPSMVAAAAAAAAACDIGVGPGAGVGIGIGVDPGGSGATRGGVTASVEFTPADVLALDAASGFLRDLLARPGMALVVPARRFLELEFLDGTLKGGSTDASRETTARQVATMAASSVGATRAVHSPAAAPSAGGGGGGGGASSPAGEDQATVGLGGRAVAGGGSAQGGAVAPAPTAGLRPSAPQLTFAPSRAAFSLPAHPDAARDLAEVCRCLGELGAAAFTSLPRVMGAASFWPERDDGAAAAAAAAAAPAAAATANGRPVAPQRGVALLA